MTTTKAHRVIAVSGTVALGAILVTTAKDKKELPGARFWIGSGVAYLLLSALAEVEPDVASAFGIAILTTVLIGEGNGVLSYIATRQQIDTSKNPSRSQGWTPKISGDASDVHAPATPGTPRRSVPMQAPKTSYPGLPKNALPTRRQAGL